MSCHSVCRAFLIAIFGTLAIAAHAVPSYTILDLGTLAGPTSRGYGVNDKGQVTGVTGAVYDPFLGGYFQHAFVWDKTSGMTDLGTITGSWSSGGNAINDNGQVTGQSWVVYPFSKHAFVWDASSGMSSLGTLEGGADMELSYGFGINNSGGVTGRSTTTDGPDHAFL